MRKLDSIDITEGSRYVSKRVRLQDRSVAIIRETGEGWTLFTNSGTPDEREYNYETLEDVFKDFSLYTYSE